MMKNFHIQKQKEISSVFSHSGNIKQLLQKHQTAPSQSKIFNTRGASKQPNTIKKTLTKKFQANPQNKISLSKEFKHITKQKQSSMLTVNGTNNHAITTPNSNNIKSTVQSSELCKPLTESNNDIKTKAEVMMANSNKNFSKNTSPFKIGKNNYNNVSNNCKRTNNVNNPNTSIHIKTSCLNDNYNYMQPMNTNSNNTPKSTNCSETTKIQQQVKPITLKEGNTNKLINDEVGILSNDVFLKKILSMFVSLKPNSEVNSNEEIIKDFYLDSQSKLKDLELKVNSIVINNTINQNMHGKSLSEIFLGSKTRIEIYKTYFDFIFKVLGEIKQLATKEINHSLILKQIDEVNSNTKLTNTCNIEDSQLEEKSHMIVPEGNIDLNNNNPGNNNSFSQFISSINSDFYQKIIYNDYENNLYGNNSFEISKSNSTYKKISAPSIKNNNKRMNLKLNKKNPYENNKVNALDITPVQFGQRKQSNDKTIKMSDTEESGYYNYANNGNKKPEMPLPIVNSVINKVRMETLNKNRNKMHPSQIINNVNLSKKAYKRSDQFNKQNTKHLPVKTNEIPKISKIKNNISNQIKTKNVSNKNQNEDNNNCLIF